MNKIDDLKLELNKRMSAREALKQEYKETVVRIWNDVPVTEAARTLNLRMDTEKARYSNERAFALNAYREKVQAVTADKENRIKENAKQAQERFSNSMLRMPEHYLDYKTNAANFARDAAESAIYWRRRADRMSKDTAATQQKQLSKQYGKNRHDISEAHKTRVTVIKDDYKNAIRPTLYNVKKYKAAYEVELASNIAECKKLRSAIWAESKKIKAAEKAEKETLRYRLYQAFLKETTPDKPITWQTITSFCNSKGYHPQALHYVMCKNGWKTEKQVFSVNVPNLGNVSKKVSVFIPA